MIFSFLFVVLGVLVYPALGQSSDAEGVVAIENVQSNGIREEIQRYFGYEDLLFRYLTLPYDLNQNVNQKGRQVDIGFTFLALFPLLLLLLVYKNRKLFYGLAGMMVLYLGMCFRYSHVVATSNKLAVTPDMNLWNQLQESRNISISESLLFSIYNLGILVSTPLRWIIDKITAEQDHVTYPVIMALFLGLIWLMSRRGSLSPQLRVALLVFSFYSFFWYITSSGIIWYGFLMIPMAFILMMFGIGHNRSKAPLFVRTIFNHFSIGILSLWLVSAYVFRVSDINPLEVDTEHKGYAIIHPILFMYSSGVRNKTETFESFTPNVSTGIRIINQDSRRVLQVGTSLVFDIKNNIERVSSDNTLSGFIQDIKKNNSQGLWNDALRKSGFGYILIDLNLPYMDKTPEQSLSKKFRTLLSAVKDNPGMRLVATDRKTIKTVNGQKIERYDVFGESISQRGSYAVYEIL